MLVLSGCDSWKADIIAKIDQESKNYCLFAKGSYWIYQDSATLLINSVTLNNIIYQKVSTANPKRSFGYEEYVMEMTYSQDSHNSYCGEYILTSEYCDECNVEQGIFTPIELIKQGGMDLPYIDFLGYITHYNNSNLYEILRSSVYYEKFYEKYSIGNNIFNKVKVFHNKREQIRTYWAKNVGIIRMEFGVDTLAVCNLIKYSVKPYNN